MTDLINKSNLTEVNPLEVAENLSREQLKKKWDNFAMKVTQYALLNRRPTLVFIHYGGHGACKADEVGQNTWIMHHNEQYSPLEQWAIELAENLNIIVFLILDCCRTKLTGLGPDHSQTVEGQIFIGYAAKKGEMATSEPDRDIPPKYTHAFISEVKKQGGVIELPTGILLWDELSYAQQYANITKKCTFMLKVNDPEYQPAMIIPTNFIPDFESHNETQHVGETKRQLSLEKSGTNKIENVPSNSHLRRDNL